MKLNPAQSALHNISNAVWGGFRIADKIMANIGEPSTIVMRG